MFVAVITLFLVGSLMSFIAAILLLVAGFKVHLGWGLAMLMIPGLPQLAFLVTHWPQARRAFMLSMVGFLFTAGGLALSYRWFSPETLWAMIVTHGDVVIHSDDGTPWDSDTFEASADSADLPILSAPVERTEPEHFLGRPLIEVEERFGAPRMRLRTGDRIIYGYPEWEFEADSRSRVVRVSRVKQ